MCIYQVTSKLEVGREIAPNDRNLRVQIGSLRIVLLYKKSPAKFVIQFTLLYIQDLISFYFSLKDLECNIIWVSVISREFSSGADFTALEIDTLTWRFSIFITFLL